MTKVAGDYVSDIQQHGLCRDTISTGVKNKAVYKDGTVGYVYDNKLCLDKQNKFKGWSCASKIYNISKTGVFYNDCTKQLLPSYFTEKNLNEYKICPNEYCDRMCFIFYNKLNYHRILNK